MKVTTQRHKLTKIQRFNQKIIEYIPFLYFSTTPTGLHYNNSGLQLKDLQDSESLLGAVLKETQSQRGTETRTLKLIWHLWHIQL